MKDPRKGNYLIRESYYQYMIHLQDDVKNVGYDWRSNLFSKTISGYILSDTKRSLILLEIQKLMVYAIDKVSMIKKSINYTVDKKYKYLN